MINSFTMPRRHMLLTSLAGTASLFFPVFSSIAQDKKTEDKVGANEDLMREHGIIRRALLVYQKASQQLQQSPQNVPLESLLDTTKLFREFAEDYHERQLEETHIFPAIHKLGGKLSNLVDILLLQHNRSREITDYIASCTSKSNIKQKDANTLAEVLDKFILMYEHHSAREDTILFPAWKEVIGAKNYEEMGEKFEEIEHQIFGNDGFENAVKHISKIEEVFGLADISIMTAPSPPSNAADHGSEKKGFLR